MKASDQVMKCVGSKFFNYDSILSIVAENADLIVPKFKTKTSTYQFPDGSAIVFNNLKQEIKVK